MTVIEKGPRQLMIRGVTDFDPAQIFESGQCFRWTRLDSGGYRGIAGRRALTVRSGKPGSGILELSGATEEEFEGFWRHYLDLDRDYREIRARLSALDPVMQQAVKHGQGLKILRQEFWETLVSFILSANNNVSRIAAIVERLARTLGSPVPGADEGHTFPEAGWLASAGREDVSLCRCGYRLGYIMEAAERVSRGWIRETELRTLSSEEARSQLMQIPGVGAKVADCVLIYSCISMDVFPVDVWVKRAMENLYFGRPACMKEITAFAKARFGELSGFAQMYLFHYARKNQLRDVTIA
ncbi:MAG TPA: hypothetical protein DD727_05545 [Clostridiales bacterium]|nr:hypothetical protein [Clostridiales bacterium]